MHAAGYAELFETVQSKKLELSSRSMSEYFTLLGPLVPGDLIAAEDRVKGRRQRIFTTTVTFWTFLSQALTPALHCREVVQRVVIHVRLWTKKTLSQNTSAFCQARKRLSLALLLNLHVLIMEKIEMNVPVEERWKGRRVYGTDGSGVSMPDTPENQKKYPQPGNQKKGCGFPVMKIVGLFSLATGVLCRVAIGNLHDHDLTLFRKLWSDLKQGDIVLGDRGFCSYPVMALLLAQGVDTVFRLHSQRKPDFRSAERLGKDDYIVTWNRPKQPPKWMSKEQHALLPETFRVRIVRCRVNRKGYRTKVIFLATTLLDATTYTHDDLAELYLQRWSIELRLRDIKITMGMDILRCKTPAMIEKELWIHVVAYNLVRSLIFEAVVKFKKKLRDISFKGALDFIRQWTPAMKAHFLSGQNARELVDIFFELLAKCLVPERSGRVEPRVIKRRPKQYQRLTRPRKFMRPTSHRSRHYAQPGGVKARG